jgi:putative protease
LFDRPSIPELLAPAGGPAALHAAVATGADAVYLGLDRFNARRGALNFTLETLRDACRFAHLRGVRVYLTLNIVLGDAELDEALSVIARAWAVGIDAVIVQDLGLLSLVRRLLPDVRVHASTQINAHSSATVEALAEMGVSRVTLARETSADEIARLVAAGRRHGAEIESFVHGAICMCYSGQCLLSSLIGGRSANRGMCAQPCRLNYDLLDATGERVADVGAYLLSPRDLAGIDALPALVAAGVASLKIEGRMKSPEYVALVTGTYRAALDRAAADPETFAVRDGERSVLEEAFSRGFSTAYLTGERGNAMMSYRRPNNRGVAVGRIVDATDTHARIALDTALESDDTIEVWTSRGRFAQQVGEMRSDAEVLASAAAGGVVTIATEEPAKSGDRVFRVRNAALNRAAERTFSAGDASAPLDLGFRVRVVVGEPLLVEVEDAHGRHARATGAVVEAARTKAVTADEVAEHVGRLGGTPFRASTWDIALSPDAGVGFSALHKVRRDALAAFEAVVLEPWSRPDPARLASVSAASRKRAPRASEPLLVAVVADVESAQACLAAGCDLAHVPAFALRDVEPRPGIVPLLPRIDHDRETEAHLAIARRWGRAVAGTLGQLHVLSADGVELEAHWSLNAFNTATVEVLERMGARRVWLSPELDRDAIAALAGRVGVQLGTAVLGRQEVMVTEHCVLMARGDCAQACAGCQRRSEAHVLEDRKGYRFPVRTDPSGRSHVYNSVPLELLGVVDEVLDTGVTALRLDLETIEAQEAGRDVQRAVSALRALASGRDLPARDRTSTSGHFFRGVT